MRFLATALLIGLFALSGCSGGDNVAGSANQAFTAKQVTVNGSVNPFVGKVAAKDVAATAGSIGTVTAIDAFTGAVISTTPADIVNNQFSVSFNVTTPKSAFVLVAKMTGSNVIYRALVPLDLSSQPSGLTINYPLTGLLVGPKSTAIVLAVETALNVKGALGIDSGVAFPTATDFAAVSNAVLANGGGVVAFNSTGITINGTMEGMATQIQFIYTSDSHYGIKRAPFNGYSSATQVNGALVNVMNNLSGVTLNCSDGGINSCKPVGAIDFIVNTGDISNRSDGTVYPTKNATASATWPQFAADYLTTLNLSDRVGNKAPMYLVPGNHDVSNAIGYYKAPLNTAAGLDATSYIQIYNLMMKPATALTNAAFIGSTPAYATAAASYAGSRVVTSRDWNGVHFVFVGMWPDSIARPLIDADLSKVASTTPVIIFTHDQPTAESKHFTNPNSPFDINSTNKFENLLSDKYADTQGTGNTPGASTDIEQRLFVAWLKTHKNIVAYFHGNDNRNEFYTYTGPDNDISLNVFRVDSPMKGTVTGNDAPDGKGDPTKLSFQVVNIDPLAKKMTVREYLWNTKQWGASTTVSLAPRAL
jgi:hypothetical protein